MLISTMIKDTENHRLKYHTKDNKQGQYGLIEYNMNQDADNKYSITLHITNEGIQSNIVTEDAINDTNHIMEYYKYIICELNEPNQNINCVFHITCDSEVTVDLSNINNNYEDEYEDYYSTNRYNLHISDNITATGTITNCYSISIYKYNSLIIQDVSMNLYIRVHNKNTLNKINFDLPYFDGSINFIIMNKESKINRQEIINKIIDDKFDFTLTFGSETDADIKEIFKFINPDFTTFTHNDEELLILMNSKEPKETQEKYITDNLHVEGIKIIIKSNELSITNIYNKQTYKRIEYTANHINELFDKIHTLNIQHPLTITIKNNHETPIDLTSVQFNKLNSYINIVVLDGFTGTITNTDAKILINITKYTNITPQGKNFHYAFHENITSMNKLTENIGYFLTTIQKFNDNINVKIPLYRHAHEGYKLISTSSTEYNTSNLINDVNTILRKINNSLNNSPCTLNVKFEHMLMCKVFKVTKAPNKPIIIQNDMSSLIETHAKYDALMIGNFANQINHLIKGKPLIIPVNKQFTKDNTINVISEDNYKEYTIEIQSDTKIYYNKQWYLIDDLVTQINTNHENRIVEIYNQITKKINDFIPTYNPEAWDKESFESFKTEYDKIITSSAAIKDKLNNLYTIIQNAYYTDYLPSYQSTYEGYQNISTILSKADVISRLWYDNDINGDKSMLCGLRYSNSYSQTFFDGEQWQLSKYNYQNMNPKRTKERTLEYRFEYEQPTIQQMEEYGYFDSYKGKIHKDEDSYYLYKMATNEIPMFTVSAYDNHKLTFDINEINDQIIDKNNPMNYKMTNTGALSSHMKNIIWNNLTESERTKLTEVGFDQQFNTAKFEEFLTKHRVHWKKYKNLYQNYKIIDITDNKNKSNDDNNPDNQSNNNNPDNQSNNNNPDNQSNNNNRNKMPLKYKIPLTAGLISLLLYVTYIIYTLYNAPNIKINNNKMNNLSIEDEIDNQSLSIEDEIDNQIISTDQ